MEKQVKKVLAMLHNNGYEAYLVGGYVRDMLIGSRSYDVDICTNALPKDMHVLFNSTKNTYGSINLIIGNFNFDITTFRKDFDYVNRRPSKVEYIDSLQEDLLRRDFTINAICMDISGKLLDYEHGIDDLNEKLIRSIGDPVSKITEDPLRILRAIRFATTLDFTLDSELYNAIKSNNYLIKTLSSERIKSELDKILLSKNFLNGLKLMDELGLSKILDLTYKENITYVDDLIGMWAQINTSINAFTNVEKSNIIKTVDVINSGKIKEETLYKYGLYICTIAGKILNINIKTINNMYKKLPIKSREDIDVTAKDIIELVGSGKLIGDTYKELEEKILKKELINKRKEIIKYLVTKE